MFASSWRASSVSVTCTPRSATRSITRVDLQVDDLRDLLARERVEAHDVIQAVDELRLEVLQQLGAQARVGAGGS